MNLYKSQISLGKKFVERNILSPPGIFFSFFLGSQGVPFRFPIGSQYVPQAFRMEKGALSLLGNLQILSLQNIPLPLSANTIHRRFSSLSLSLSSPLSRSRACVRERALTCASSVVSLLCLLPLLLLLLLLCEFYFCLLCFFFFRSCSFVLQSFLFLFSGAVFCQNFFVCLFV